MRKGLITVEFGELVNLGKDKFNPTTNANMPCIELEHIDSGTGTINGSVDSSEQKSLKNVFHKGDILFSKLRPYLRKYWFADFDGVCSSEIWVLKPKEIVLPQYLFYLIQTEEFIRISNVSSGSKMPRADWDFINHYPLFIIHSLPEQHRIVSVLSLWDTAIAKQTALIEKLTLRKKGLMQQLLTGKKRLKGFGGEWKNIKLGNIAERITRKNEEDNRNVVTISAQRGFVVQTDFFNKSVASETLDNYFLVHKNEFCYNKSYSNGYPMGAIKRLKSFDKAVVTTLYICFRLKEKLRTNIDFFEQYCESGLLNKELVKVANEGGRAHGLLNVTPADFFNMHMRIPSIEEQTAIASVLVNADKEIEIQKQKLASMQAQKRELMQVLLTGKRRIK